MPSCVVMLGALRLFCSQMRLELDQKIINERVLGRCSHINLATDQTTFDDQKYLIELSTFATRKT